MTRDTRKVRLVDGQTDLGWGQDEAVTFPDAIVVCRVCHSSRLAPPLVRTVDPRWVHATCLDCGDRVIANVYPRSTPSQTGEQLDEPQSE
jgi:hypothetical protein